MDSTYKFSKAEVDAGFQLLKEWHPKKQLRSISKDELETALVVAAATIPLGNRRVGF